MNNILPSESNSATNTFIRNELAFLNRQNQISLSVFQFQIYFLNLVPSSNHVYHAGLLVTAVVTIKSLAFNAFK